MIRRNKTSIFIDAKETTTVLDVKKMVEGKKINNEYFSSNLN